MFAPKRAEIPTSPGSYQFYSESNEVLYVGKAKNLRSRIMSYFQNGPKHNMRIDQMVEIADRIEWIVVSNETESLLLEYSLIQQHKPRYNVRLKDDKSYPWLAISASEKWPAARVYRGKQKKGTKYFGPYTSAYTIRETLDVLTTVFPIRTCNPGKFADYRSLGRGCLLHDLGKCSAPCIDAVSEEQYGQYISDFISFINGDTKGIVKMIESEMKIASSNQQFERAATLRDRLNSLETIIERQEIYGTETENFDVVSFANDAIEICVEVFRIRRGRLMGSRRMLLEPQEIPEGENFSNIIMLKLYEDQLPEVIPPVVYLSQMPTNFETYQELLSEQRAAKVRLHVPQKGSKKKLLELATQNAKGSLDRRIKTRINDIEQRTAALKDLYDQLSLSRIPLRIECFDVSHIQGTNTVASMVVLDDGLPRKSEYRKFTINHDQGNDDFLSMEEVITRRFNGYKREDEKFSVLPDLLLIDGGKGQLSSAMRALESLGLDSKFDVASIAKREEEVFRPGMSEPRIINPASLSLMILQLARDEAHRFAITHHRSKRSKAMTASILDEIPGLGSARKKKLLLSFGSIKALREQSLETLISLNYIPNDVAQAIYLALQENSQEN